MKLPMYDIEPRTENNWIAPSAKVIGEPSISSFQHIAIKYILAIVIRTETRLDITSSKILNL